MFPLLLVSLFAPFPTIAEFTQAPLAQDSLLESQTCPHPHISCPSSTPSDVDTCCLNHPSGHFLLTQFWDTSPSLGPTDSWTIHGLWPDLCHGGFDQYCDSSRSQSNIQSILSSTSPDLNDFMSKYWLSLNGDSNHLWSHEWNKHGTCISTLEPDCYASSQSSNESSHKDIIDYFTHATTLFSTLNTYDALAASGIIPTYRQAYDLADLQSAISTLQGAEVTLRCRGHELQEIWYHFTVHGSLRDATPFSNETITSAATISATKHKFRAVDPDGSASNCPATGIRYLPKQPDQPMPTHTPSISTSTSTTSPSSTSTATPFSGKGHLLVRPISNSSSSSPSNETIGCLIRSGSWYRTSGSSCANYIARTDPQHLADPFGFNPEPQPSSPPPQSPPPSIPSISTSEPEHIFTLSSLYAPCAVIPSAFPSDGGLFLCRKNLGIQSIFSSVIADATTGIHKLAHLDKTTFYAYSVPEKLEKVGIYADDKDGERTVQVEILWEAL